MTQRKDQNAGAEDHFSHSASAPIEELPGLPGFLTWRGVYFFVIGSFLLWVVLLALLSRTFS